MRKSPRERRLNSDYRSVQALSDESSIFEFRSSGSPPQKYHLIFHGAGFQRDHQGIITVSNRHEVIVELGAAYPRMIPNLAWQTPIFHPNISHNGVVCLGGYGTHWVPSLTLSEMCTMLWDMIRYHNFDTESPYNREAALWAKSQTDFVFPVDRRSIRDQMTTQQVISDNQNEIFVTNVNTNDHAPAGESSRGHDGIEIIESGIEIIETSPASPIKDGILFLD